jgi:hypothetical protein
MNGSVDFTEANISNAEHTICLNISVSASSSSSSDGDVNCYIIIRKLLNSIFNIQWEPKSQYERSCWTQLPFVRLFPQGMKYPQKMF